MVIATLCFIVVITAIVCNVFTGAAKVVSLIALGIAALCMFLDAKYLDKILINISNVYKKCTMSVKKSRHQNTHTHIYI